MSKLTTTIVSGASWTCPAGVTDVIIQPCDVTGTIYAGTPTAVAVAPMTTYSMIIQSATYSYGLNNFFGSAYVWTGSAYLKLTYVE